MPYPINLTVLSGQSVSSGFALDRCERPVVLYVASHAAIGVRLECAPSSASTVFGPAFTVDGITQVFSTAQDAWGYFIPPTPWGRIRLSTGASATTSFMILMR